MAAAKYNIVVKGNPDTNELGDCPFCHRVLLTLEAKGLHDQYDLTPVDFARKPDWLVAIGKGTVPVLRREGADPLPDSDAITAWLEEAHPTPSLATTVDPSIASKPAFPAFRGFLFAPAGSVEEAEKKAALEADLVAINDYLNQPGRGPLYGGEGINATDASVAPKLYHIQTALGHYKGYRIPAELIAIHKYLAHIKSLPAWKAVDYGEKKIIEGWGKHH